MFSFLHVLAQLAVTFRYKNRNGVKTKPASKGKKMQYLQKVWRTVEKDYLEVSVMKGQLLVSTVFSSNLVVSM